MRAAQAFTGETLRATVERALDQMVAGAEQQASARRQRIANHLAHADAEVDVDALLSDRAWR